MHISYSQQSLCRTRGGLGRHRASKHPFLWWLINGQDRQSRSFWIVISLSVLWFFPECSLVALRAFSECSECSLNVLSVLKVLSACSLGFLCVFSVSMFSGYFWPGSVLWVFSELSLSDLVLSECSLSVFWVFPLPRLFSRCSRSVLWVFLSCIDRVVVILGEYCDTVGWTFNSSVCWWGYMVVQFGYNSSWQNKQNCALHDFHI